jgi:hypothetical protein
MDNLKQLIGTLGINLTAVSAPFNPNMENSDKMFHWACCLSVKDRPLDGFNMMFSKGGGHLQLKERKPIFPLGIGGGVTYNDVKNLKDNIRGYFYDFDLKVIRKRGRTSMFEAELAGQMLEAAPPTAEEVLDCLLSDAMALEYDTFEDWASDYGYDTDSIKARDTFHFVRKQSKQLITLLGRENFRAAMAMERL